MSLSGIHCTYRWNKWLQGSFLADSILSLHIAQCCEWLFSSSFVAAGNLYNILYDGWIGKCYLNNKAVLRNTEVDSQKLALAWETCKIIDYSVIFCYICTSVYCISDIVQHLESQCIPNVLKCLDRYQSDISPCLQCLCDCNIIIMFPQLHLYLTIDELHLQQQYYTSQTGHKIVPQL